MSTPRSATAPPPPPGSRGPRVGPRPAATRGGGTGRGTEAFGHIFARAVLLTRRREQREQVGRAMGNRAEGIGRYLRLTMGGDEAS